jgi:hypothetical protein
VSYQSLLARKALSTPPVGIPNPPELHPSLFDFQAAVTRWALRRGRACLFLDTGLGKSRCEIEWARVVSEHTGKPVMIFTPLAVARQFIAEGAALGVEVTLCREPEDVRPGVNVTNYDRAERFDPEAFGGVVLDESSILKDFSSKTRNYLTEAYRPVRFKLCGTATPAPNDHTELGNHAEFLGVMTRVEMLSMFFVHDGATTQEWRLKGHAQGDFWKWVASWAMAIRSPEDIGFDGARYILPPLSIEEIVVGDSADLARRAGQLFAYQAKTLSEVREARRASLVDRVQAAAELVNSSSEPWIAWCDLNQESEALAAAIPDAVEVTGSDSADEKERRIWSFLNGEKRVLVSKPSICGAGLNMQHCAREAFVGLGHSWELYYQAIRRVYRFGQKRPVEVKIITSEAEGRVLETIRRKQADADAMAAGMVEHMRDAMLGEIGAADRTKDDYRPTKEMVIPRWLLTA